MAGERQLPGLGLYGFWTTGSNGWGDQNDTNIRALSVLCQAGVQSHSALPGSPSAGDIILVADGEDDEKQIAVYDGEPGSEAWVYISPNEGWMVFVQDEDTFKFYDGTDWAVAFDDTPAIINKVASYATVDADFESRTLRLIEMEVGAANDLTVSAGHTGTKPVGIIQKGVGQTTLVADTGVTLLSEGGNLKLSSQYAAATLIPLGSDTYYVIGSLSA